MNSLIDVALHPPPTLEVNSPKMSTTAQHYVASKNPFRSKIVDDLHTQNKHAEVVQLWEQLKAKAPASLTPHLLSLFVTSAEMEGRPQLVLTMVEFAENLGVSVCATSGLRFVRACRAVTADKTDPSAWHKAAGMLEKVAFRQLESGRSSAPPTSPKDLAVIVEMIEEAVRTCAASGKWRNTLDIIEKVVALKLNLTEKMLSAAIVCCAREKNGVVAAFNLFKYTTRRGVSIPRTMQMYTFLLQGLSRESLLVQFEAVWEQMAEDRMPLSDAAYATRVEVLSQSRLSNSPAPFDLSPAEGVFHEALGAIKHPRATFHAMYLAYLKAGRVPLALQLLSTMKERGIQPPERLDASSHVIGLCKLGLFEEALAAMQEYVSMEARGKGVGTREDHGLSHSEGAVGTAREINVNAWQSLFRGAVAKGHVDTALRVYHLAASTGAAAVNEQWLSLLLPALGDQQRWQEAIDLVDTPTQAHPRKYGQTNITKNGMKNDVNRGPPTKDVSALLCMLVACKQGSSAVRLELALEYHRKALVKARLHESAGKGSLAVFVGKVSADFLQQLAIGHQWEDLFSALEDVHSAMRSGEGEGSADGSLLALLYTTAMRCTVSQHLVIHSQGVAQQLMAHQRRHGVRPWWSCVRYALKALYVEEQWEPLLDLFAVRAQTIEYRGADELAYIRALKACRELGHWQEALELLADLLVERNDSSGLPDPSLPPLGASVYELTLETLVAADQRELVVEVVRMMSEGRVAHTPRTSAIAQQYSLTKMRDIMTAVSTHEERRKKHRSAGEATPGGGRSQSGRQGKNQGNH